MGQGVLLASHDILMLSEDDVDRMVLLGV